MTILVCGGRNFGEIREKADSPGFKEDAKRAVAEIELLTQFLDALHEDTPIEMVIQGGARGADRHAHRWQVRNGIHGKTYKPDWTRHKGMAGRLRNVEMLDCHPEIKLVIAFPGGAGTAHMKQIARERKIPLVEIA